MVMLDISLIPQACLNGLEVSLNIQGVSVLAWVPL